MIDAAIPAGSCDAVSCLETHQNLAAVVEHSNDAIFSRTLDGVITTWNAAAARIFGFPAGEIIGRTSRVLLPRGHQDEFRKLLARIRSVLGGQIYVSESCCARSKPRRSED